MSRVAPKSEQKKLKILSCSEVVELQEQKERTRSNKPQPWLARKIVIPFVILIFGWCSYVYVGRVIVGMLLRKENAMGSRSLGVVLLIIFGILWIMFVWTYIKVIITPPGFARDHVPKTERPAPSFPDPPVVQPKRLQPTILANGTRKLSSSSNYLPDEDEWEKRANGGIGADYSDFRLSADSPPIHGGTRSPSSPTAPTVTRPSVDVDLGSGTPRNSTSPNVQAGKRSPSLEIEEMEIDANESSFSGERKLRKLTRSPPASPNTSNVPAPPNHPKTKPSFSSSHRSRSAESFQTATEIPQSITSAISLQTSTTLFHQPSTSRPGSSPKEPQETIPEHEPSSPTRRGKLSQESERTRTASPTDSRNVKRSPTSASEQKDRERIRRLTADESLLTSTPIPNGRPSEAFTISTAPSRPRIPSQQRHDFPPRSPSNASYVSDDDLPPPLHSRRPPTQPVLDPEYRYCARDGLVKPFRTHHCRMCGTCVLYYDHHCPWIGQCVGARNRKFFVNFLIWASLMTFFVVVSLIPLVVIHNRNDEGDIEWFSVSVIIISLLFFLFTFSLLSTHIHLLLYNASTVEWYGFQRMRERERAVLSNMFPPCIGGPCGCGSDEGGPYSGPGEGGNSFCCKLNPGAIQGKRQTRKLWDEEWGRIAKEGNLWWRGSKRENWEEVMGASWLSWILPIGDTSRVGLDYKPNPRFDANGRWRKRRQWPQELR